MDTKERIQDMADIMNDVYSKSGLIGKQYVKELESTKALCNFMLKVLPPEYPGKFLDAGCGDGSIMYSVKKRFPNSKLTGFDVAPVMLDCARRHLSDDMRLEAGDLRDMSRYINEGFDVVYSVHTLSLFSEFEPITAQMIKTASRYVFIKSLFSTHNVDMFATIYETGRQPIAWNIFSIDRFKKFVLENGAKNVFFKPFNISIELEDPLIGMGSYTRRMDNGEYLTFSGPLFLPWYLVRIDVEK